MAKVIEIFGDDGQPKQYRPLSERLPEFLKTYPPSEGFRMVVEARNRLSLNPGLEVLYKEAITSGRNFAEIGLPPVTEAMVFTASLFDKNGNVVANASAMRFRMDQYKDWEKGETAARQRLLAALGFGGDILDEDETGDLADQGRLKNEKLEGEERGKTRAPRAKAEPRAQAPTPTPSEAPAPHPPADSEPETSAETIPPALLRQIEHQAKIKGKPVPAVSTIQEAREKLKSLMAA